MTILVCLISYRARPDLVVRTTSFVLFYSMHCNYLEVVRQCVKSFPILRHIHCTVSQSCVDYGSIV